MIDMIWYDKMWYNMILYDTVQRNNFIFHIVYFNMGWSQIQ